jgi:hypothetical protein
MIYDQYLPSDHAFTLFLESVDIEAVRLERAAHMSPYELHALSRDRRRER